MATVENRLNRPVVTSITNDDVMEVIDDPIDTAQKKLVAASDVRSYMSSPTRITLPQVDEAATPTLAFGDGNTGFYEPTDNTIRIAIAGSASWEFSATLLGLNVANRPALKNVAASATVPSVIPDSADADTGIGHRTADIGVLIAGAKNCLEFGEAGAAPLLGFYATAAVAKPTGVAVSAAGVHAALVTLGLIAGP